jgi:peroxiredoxin
MVRLRVTGSRHAAAMNSAGQNTGTQGGIGRRCPSVVLAELRLGEIRSVTTESLFMGRRALIIGVPGAFTPVCSRTHLPDIVAQADRFRAAGFSVIACITPNDPWVNDVWSQEIDPKRKLTMLSDGNLDFARGLGLLETNREYFLGERSKRYMLQLTDSVIERMGVEQSILNVTCTRADDIMLD